MDGGAPAEPDGSSATGGITADAGTRVARWSSSSVSANGPLPTGRRAKSLVARSANGTSASRWAGSSGCVAAARTPPIGVPRVSRTVLLSTASTVTSAQAAAPAPAASGLLSASTVNTTSSAVTGSPSCHVGVVADGEGPGLAGRVARPRRGEVGLVRRARAQPHEAGEHETDERALGAGARRHRGDRLGHADDALAVDRARGHRDLGRGLLRRGAAGWRRDRDDRAQHDEHEDEDDDDRAVAAVHDLGPALGGRGRSALSRRRRTPPARTGRTARAGGP